MIRDDILLTTLVIMRLNGNDEDAVPYALCVPTAVREELVRRKWLSVDQDLTDSSSWGYNITDAGMLVSDLFSPEMGVDPVSDQEEV